MRVHRPAAVGALAERRGQHPPVGPSSPLLRRILPLIMVVSMLSWSVDTALAQDADQPPPIPVAQATPNCPGGGAVDTDGPVPGAIDSPDDFTRCTSLKVVGNTYLDRNHSGRYESHGGDQRLPGVTVRLYDASHGQLIGEAITNEDGTYRFPGLPLGPTYRVEALLPPEHRSTTPLVRDLELRDFSTLWCCSARVDFGFDRRRGAVPPPGPPPPPSGPGGPVAPPPCCEIPYGRQIHLPVLNRQGGAALCSSIVEVQNIGAWPSKAMLVVWGPEGYCPPQCSGPLKVECSGLLAPGSAWHFYGDQLPDTAASGMVFSAPAIDTATAPGAPGVPGGGDIFADLLCEALFHEVVGNCDNYRRFKKAFNEYGVWHSSRYSFDFRTYAGAALAAEVVRKCPGDADPMVEVTGGYAGLADEQLGSWDPVYNGFAFFVPLIYAGEGGFNTWLHIQNGGYECSSLELWFREQDDCNRARVCDVLTLAPGESSVFDASSCVGPDFTGSAWVRGSQPLSIVADIVGHDVLMTYHGNPAELKYQFEGPPVFTTGSQVAFGPLTYSEYQGWDTLVQVQNLSQVTNAKIKVYFLDRSGAVIQTLIDWVCPSGSQSYYLPVVSGLPGQWIGGVRVESQDWFVAGQPSVQAPSVTGVVTLIKYSDATRTAPLEAVAYDLFSEQRAFDWQVGSGWGGLYSGVGRIGIPSFMKDARGTGLTTELAINNLVPAPGFTDFAIFIYDQNGLVQHLCQKLNERQVEYIDVDGQLGFLPQGFKGSAVISAVFWEHLVLGDTGGPARNLVGLSAVKIERSGTTLGNDIPGDESAASQGFPIVGRFAFAGPLVSCPGVPAHAPWMPPGAPRVTSVPPQPTPLPPSGPGGPTAPAPPPGGPTSPAPPPVP